MKQNEKQVVSGSVLEERVGPVAEVDYINAVWDGSDDRKVVPDWLLRDGSEIAGDLNLWVGGFRKWVLEFFGNYGRKVEAEGHSRSFLKKISIRVFIGFIVFSENTQILVVSMIAELKNRGRVNFQTNKWE